jgi:uncharacterized protein YecA (UPF0149 family)
MEDTMKLTADQFMANYNPTLEIFGDELKQERIAWGQRMGVVRQEPIKVGDKVGRNDPCPCGSNKKFKKCCA